MSAFIYGVSVMAASSLWGNKKSQNIRTDHSLITKYSYTITKTADRRMYQTSGITLYSLSKKVEGCTNQLYNIDILPFHLEKNAFWHNNYYFFLFYLLTCVKCFLSGTNS